MKKIIIANWKMNLSIKQGLLYLRGLRQAKEQVIIAAPATFLATLSKSRPKEIFLAAQDVSRFAKGAFTGEISAKMLKESGCQYCLVGHSEQRFYFQENDGNINLKIHNLIKEKIRPILCLGENYKEREKGLTEKVLSRQIGDCLKNVKDVTRIIIAYEPVWAISTFQTSKKSSASAKDISQAHIFIKKKLRHIFGSKSTLVKIIYGGTVTPQNSAGILNLPEVDGCLVGNASLKLTSFNAIISSIK